MKKNYFLAIILLIISCSKLEKNNLQDEKTIIFFPKKYSDINLAQLEEFFPKVTDTIQRKALFNIEHIEINSNNNFKISLLHNSGTFDQIFLCSHNKNYQLIDCKYIGKATDFDGKGHTIDYQVSNNSIKFKQVDWGYKNNKSQEPDTIKYYEDNYIINENGKFLKTKN